MAIANFGICDPGPGVDISLDYDDGTLLVEDVNYANTSAQDARITLTISGSAHNLVLAAGTVQTTRDISSLGIHMVATTPPKGSPSIGLPSNISVNCAWPA
jgi:hypothetical protein